jgi:hypothetical protein
MQIEDVANIRRAMDVFGVREQLIDDYREFTGSFVDIHEPRIREHVAARMARGYQWPDPWLSLNPNFASAGSITDLIASGLLHPETEHIYTGQESETARREITADPPDILLTNYVMLELLLTWPRERKLIEATQSLQFLVRADA